MNVVGYCRLSRDEDNENNTSIESQQDIIRECAKKHGWQVQKMYIDDNYSGYLFDRPDFNQLKKAIGEGKVDVLIAKDLSRLGRSNPDVLMFLRGLKQAEIRILLPAEGSGFDSDLNSSQDIMIGFKSLINEVYVIDISQKVRSSLSSRQKDGKLLMGTLFYGYQKDRYIKHKLYVDENVRPVIELIFKLYLEGKGYKKICDILDRKGIPTPSKYLQQQFAEQERALKSKVSEKWQTHNIARILQNDLYIGVLRTHKRESKDIKGKQRYLPKSQHHVFLNHHEAIISETDFYMAQKMNGGKTTHYRGSIKHHYIFTGFVKCGDCGSAATGMNLSRRPDIKLGYECTMYTKYGLNRCVSHRVYEEDILFYLKEFFKIMKEEYEQELLKYNVEESKKVLEHSIYQCRDELKTAQEHLKITLNQKIRDLIKCATEAERAIVEETYNQIENEQKQRISVLTVKLTQLEKSRKEGADERLREAINFFDSIIQSDRPSKKTLSLILDKILIYREKPLEFKLLVNYDIVSTT